MDESHYRFTQPTAYPNVSAIVKAIEATPDGVLVSSEGDSVFILSDRDTESFVMFTTLNGMNFTEMSIDELRDYMRRKLTEAGIDDIEV